MKSLILCDDWGVDATADFCEANGFGIEIQHFFLPTQPADDPLVKKYAARIANLSPRAMHGTFADLCPGSIDPDIQDITRRRFEASYHVARGLNVKHLGFHNGYTPHTAAPGVWFTRAVEFWKAFLADKPETIQIHIENALEWEPGLLLDIVEAIDRPDVDLNLDIGHTHCNSKTDPLKWVETLGARIGYVHMNDNQGVNDEHLALGQGTLPVLDVCQALEEAAPDAVWSLEVRAENFVPSLLWLQDNGFLNKELNLDGTDHE